MDDQRADRNEVGAQVTVVPKTGGKLHALHEHLYRLKLITYSVLLIVGVTQIILRENFPQIKMPWPWIGGALIVGLLGFVAVSTIIQISRTNAS
jgi:hypothetical protein